MKRLLSIDIGSTWTKAALFGLEDIPSVLGTSQVPTTQDDLSRGVAAAACALLGLASDTSITRIGAELPVHVCSSAKGGLSIAAIGIVPDLTVSVARLVASSAGGRIAAHTAYKITDRQLAVIEAMKPDIVLLCGGTDGGNETYVLHNARALAGMRGAAAVVYAGNATLEAEVLRILSGRPLQVVRNVMPEVGVLDIEPARAAIRSIFLQRIVEGKGLEAVRAACAGDIRPTPLAVYELLEAIAASGDAAAGGPPSLLLIDMGGATTDVYSLCPAFSPDEGTVLRGIEPPSLMRTVEGDLGLRVGADSAAETGHAYVEARLQKEGASAGAFAAWVQSAREHTAVLPGNDAERLFDDILAEACLFHALCRHAGTAEEVWTPGGKVRIQRGKDLRGVTLIAASGGWLARRGSDAPLKRALSAAQRDTGAMRLLPVSPRVAADTRYLLPLLGNIAAAHRKEAALLASECVGGLMTAGEMHAR